MSGWHIIYYTVTGYKRYLCRCAVGHDHYWLDT